MLDAKRYGYHWNMVFGNNHLQLGDDFIRIGSSKAFQFRNGIRQIGGLRLPALGDNDFRMTGGQSLFAVGVQFFEHFFTGPQTYNFDFDVFAERSPERRIMSAARSMMRTGSPMSSRRICPSSPIAPA